MGTIVENRNAKVQQLEDSMVGMPLNLDMDTDHYFFGGLYARALHIPAGVTLTGKIHKHDHLNFLMKGRISVMTDEGVKELEAPAIIPATKGIKRAGYAHTDTTWVTVHVSNSTTVEEAEEELVEPCEPHIQAAIDAHNKKLELGENI